MGQQWWSRHSLPNVKAKCYFSGIFILLTQQYKSTVCESYKMFEWPEPRDEYTDKKYYKMALGLIEIPTDIPEDSVEVYLSYNNITKIKANAFSQLANCTNLFLQRNQISEIEPGAFNELTALEYLDLSYNRLERLHRNMFSDLMSCLALSVSTNQISEVEPGTFNGLSALKNLKV